MANKFRVDVHMDDLLEARRTFDAMGQLPARIVTAAAGRGATVVKRAVKNSAEIPVLTGTMRKAVRRLRANSTALSAQTARQC